MRPTVLNICTGYLPFCGSNCGLKGAAILHNWLPCAIQDCGSQALAVPFCITARTMEKFKKELKNAFKLLLIVVIGIPVFFAGLYGFASMMAYIFNDTGSKAENVSGVSSQNLSLICSKEEGSQIVSYYFIETVSAVDQTIQFPKSLRDVTIQMSRISNKGGWDNKSLCTPNVLDLPQEQWRMLSVGSDCGIGASISACDADTIKGDRGIEAVKLFPLVNGLYSGAAGMIEKGTLIKITGLPSK